MTSIAKTTCPPRGIEQRLFTIPEVAKLLSTSEPQVYALVRS